MIFTTCPLCGSSQSKDYVVLFKANFASQSLPKLFSARRLPDKIHYQMVRCKKDDLVRSNPILPPTVLSKLYRQSSFTYQTEVENLSITYLHALQPILAKIKFADPILEIGCGSGFVLTALKKLGYHKVKGVEPSTDAVAHAPAALKKNITCQAFTAKLFPAHSFRVIFFLQTLDHIADPNRFLRDCWRLLKPGGYILSFHHNVNSFSVHLLQERHPIFDIEHTHLYSPQTTRALFEKQKFVIQQITSPQNIISLSHLLWLLPLPINIKKKVFALQTPVAKKVLSFSLPLSLGNTCLIAQKPVTL